MRIVDVTIGVTRRQGDYATTTATPEVVGMIGLLILTPFVFALMILSVWRMERIERRLRRRR